MSEKNCTIVGVGPGVSMAVARAFAREGYSLALVSRTQSKLDGYAEDLRESGVAAAGFAADAGDAAALKYAFDRIRLRMGDPDVLIYNAAVLRAGRPSSLSPEQLYSDFGVDVVGALVAVQEVLPAMVAAGRGTILLTGGGLALEPWCDYASLAIGKAGLRSLAYTLAQELSSTGVHVGTVTICGIVEPKTRFDPDKIAESFLTLHRQSTRKFEIEVVYK